MMRHPKPIHPSAPLPPSRRLETMSLPIIVQARGSGFAVEFEGLRVSPFYGSYSAANDYITRSMDNSVSGQTTYRWEDFPS